jgi:hypothetical protein
MIYWDQILDDHASEEAEKILSDAFRGLIIEVTM